MANNRAILGPGTIVSVLTEEELNRLLEEYSFDCDFCRWARNAVRPYFGREMVILCSTGSRKNPKDSEIEEHYYECELVDGKPGEVLIYCYTEPFFNLVRRVNEAETEFAPCQKETLRKFF